MKKPEVPAADMCSGQEAKLVFFLEQSLSILIYCIRRDQKKRSCYNIDFLMSWEPHFHMIGNRYTEFGMDNLIKLIGLPMNILISAWVLEVLGVKIKIFEKITIFLESLN